MRKMTKNELNLILEKHKVWLEDNSKGERADLSNTDLRNVNFSYVNLSHANLIYANLSFADLTHADLYRADLSFANLSYANLSEANLMEANLFGADLIGTDLSNVDLSDLVNFDFIFNHTITDKNYYQAIGIGSRKGITTYCLEDNWIYCLCWNNYKGGTLEEFEERIEKIYGKCEEEPNKKYYKEYKNAIKYFKTKK